MQPLAPMKAITYAQSPVELPLRMNPQPVPVDGCGVGVCAALVGQRREAVRSGDYTTVSDCNVELRNHPHQTGGGA